MFILVERMAKEYVKNVVKYVEDIIIKNMVRDQVNYYGIKIMLKKEKNIVKNIT